MRRTEQAQGLRLMKFEEVYGRLRRGVLSQAEAAEVLGMSERNFRRWRVRYEADGAEGLYDRRLGRVSARRAAVDEVMAVLELFDSRYGDFGVKHLHETLVAEHGFRRSYNWLRIILQAHGRVRPAPRRGAHRRKRPRRPMIGMMLHQDGSRHEWVTGETWDLIVTMDDATSEIYAAFFVAEEGTMSTFRGLHAGVCQFVTAFRGQRADPGKRRRIRWQTGSLPPSIQWLFASGRRRSGWPSRAA
jgi:transposase